MKHGEDKYASFVEHSRYGRGPRVTGLNPKDDHLRKVIIHKHSPKTCRIPGTAIEADLTRQTRDNVPVTHYFDVERMCRKCNRPFIFFAEEQKYWYEKLGFRLDSDCVHCQPCRKKLQGIAHERERYEELFHVANRSIEQNLEMAGFCLALIEKANFSPRQSERVRMLLNQVPQDRRSDRTVMDLAARLEKIEEKSQQGTAQGHSPAAPPPGHAH